MSEPVSANPWGMPLSEVAKELGKSYDWTRRHAEALGFTILPKRKRPVYGMGIFVPPGEVRAFKAGGIDALKAYQREQKKAVRELARKLAESAN